MSKSSASSHCTSIVSKTQNSLEDSSISSISSCNSSASNLSEDWKGFKVLHPLQILLIENAQNVHEDVVNKKEKIE
jgi:hypothetical protein